MERGQACPRRLETCASESKLPHSIRWRALHYPEACALAKRMECARLALSVTHKSYCWKPGAFCLHGKTAALLSRRDKRE